MQDMLETCRTVEEATHYITGAKCAGNGLITLADTEGGLKSVELPHQHSSVREPSKSMVINTDHELIDEMMKFEIPHEAAFTENGPIQWAGKRFHGSSEARLERGQDLLGKEESMDEQMVISILRDHGENDQPSNCTICQHGD